LPVLAQAVFPLRLQEGELPWKAKKMKNEVFWLIAGGATAFAVFAARLLCPRGRVRNGLANLGLTLIALTISLAVIEWFLGARERALANVTVMPAPQVPSVVAVPAPAEPLTITMGQSEVVLPASLVEHMRRRRALLTMPDDFPERVVSPPCPVARAAQWQGVIHLYDSNGYRRCEGPFPEKSSDVFRIAVFGDSLTYGAGIEFEWSYAAQLQRLLAGDHRVEVLNLGVGGAQSEDVLRQMQKMVPVLKPELVIYGVCLNDFLPSGIGQYDHDWSVPLPISVKRVLTERTRLGRFVSDSYTDILLVLGLSMDFVDDILKDIGSYQERFERDLVAMQRVVGANGLPPIVGMVLNAYPERQGRIASLVEIAERRMRNAKIHLVSTAEYNRRFHGQGFGVSRWDGHPNEQANAFFAVMLADDLIARDDVRKARTSNNLRSSRGNGVPH